MIIQQIQDSLVYGGFMKTTLLILAVLFSLSSFAVIPESCSSFVKAAANTENGRRDYVKNNPDATLIPIFPAGTFGVYMEDVIPFCEVIRRDDLKNNRRMSSEEVERQVSITKQEAMDLYKSLLNP
jgi:hypothetical protein